jgi:hypothetical protein
MNRSAFLGFVALFSTGLALPASADYVRIGNVDVGYRTDRVTQWTRFGGHMEGLRLVADGNDVWCRSIVAHFGNGGSQNVYSGMLREDRPLYVDLKGGTRLVTDVTFTCRSDRRGGAKIYIAANVGRFQNEWRSSPGWATVWSRIFRWGPQSGYDANYWVTLGRERFEGRNDRETTFTGWSGRSVERIGLRAINDDARCSRVRVAFGNGDVKVYDVGRLDQGRMRTIDRPGGNRNVRNINLVCHAVHGRAVTIEIMARK